MADLLKSLSYAASGMEAQSARLRHVAENISNVDTPGYHRKLVSFDENMADGTVQAGKVVLDRTALEQVYDPGNPLADATGEQTATAAMTGGADPQALVQALANSQLAVETVSTLRDKVVEAYQEILRMPV